MQVDPESFCNGLTLACLLYCAFIFALANITEACKRTIEHFMQVGFLRGLRDLQIALILYCPLYLLVTIAFMHYSK